MGKMRLVRPAASPSSNVCNFYHILSVPLAKFQYHFYPKLNHTCPKRNRPGSGASFGASVVFTFNSV